MLRDMQLFKGHPAYKKIEKLLQSRYIGSIIANHVCVKCLSTHDVPTLIQHKLLKPGDRKIWFGLKDLPCWITITNEQYKALKPKIGKALPTMAISTIKFDENGQPKRAKYRIVVLGNLDRNK